MLENISLDDPAEGSAWFTNFVEPLADSFDPVNAVRYVSLFCSVLEPITGASAEAMATRYERVRRPKRFSGPDPQDVFVLSRVTLGADIAIAGVLLYAAKLKFPNARIWFTGPVKSYELFAADPRILHAPAPYNRSGSIRERIQASLDLARVVDHPGAIVLDPDSRLTQLGLVPVCPEDQYYFFETRFSDEPGSLSQMATRWVEATFGIAGARPYIAPPPVEAFASITVSLGVGGNSAKRVPDPFERMFMEELSRTGIGVLVDKGAGGEESERVMRAVDGLPFISVFDGSFAEFAGHIAQSLGYAGYDSAGQHAAAAAGIPLVAVFAGYPNARFLERWHPTGPGPVRIKRASDAAPDRLAGSTVTALLEVIRSAYSPEPANT